MLALKQSIEKQGLISPIIVRMIDNNKYQILSGHKRYTACQQLYFKTIDAVVIDVADDDIAFDILCQANIQRKEPKPSELSEMFNTYLNMRKEQAFSREKTIKDICDMFNISKKSMYRYANIARLHPGFASLIDNKAINIRFIETLLKLNDEQQKAIIDYYNRNDKLSAKVLNFVISYMLTNGSTDVYRAVLFADQERENHTKENSIYDILRNKNAKYADFTDEQFNEIILAVFDKIENDRNSFKAV